MKVTLQVTLTHGMRPSVLFWANAKKQQQTLALFDMCYLLLCIPILLITWNIKWTWFILHLTSPECCIIGFPNDNLFIPLSCYFLSLKWTCKLNSSSYIKKAKAHINFKKLAKILSNIRIIKLQFLLKIGLQTVLAFDMEDHNLFTYLQKSSWLNHMILFLKNYMYTILFFGRGTGCKHK